MVALEWVLILKSALYWSFVSLFLEVRSCSPIQLMTNALDCLSTPLLDGLVCVDMIRYSPGACSCLNNQTLWS